MATSSYSTVHVTILSMLFSFLGGTRYPSMLTTKCWQLLSFGFVFQFQRETVCLNFTLFIGQKYKSNTKESKKDQIRCQTQVQSLSCLVIFNIQRIKDQVYVRCASWFLLNLIFELCSVCCNCLSLRSNQTFLKGLHHSESAAVYEQKYIYKDITQSKSW